MQFPTRKEIRVIYIGCSNLGSCDLEDAYHLCAGMIYGVDRGHKVQDVQDISLVASHEAQDPFKIVSITTSGMVAVPPLGNR